MILQSKPKKQNAVCKTHVSFRHKGNLIKSSRCFGKSLLYSKVRGDLKGWVPSVI